MRRRMSAPTLELADIQGNVLRGYGMPYAAYAFVRVGSRARARAWLGDLAGEVTDARPWSAGKVELALNVALTYSGLEALGVPPATLATLPDEFRAGMAAAAQRLGDKGDSRPAAWEDGLRPGQGHVLVSLHARRAGTLIDRLKALREQVRVGGIGELVHEQPAELLPFGREHFGFSDGFAQPSVYGSGQPNRPGEGVPRRLGGWRLLRPGELVLGYEDEDGTLPAAPAAPFDRNATFMVYRKLSQDVAAFRSFLRAAADAHTDGDEERLAAKLVGRWRDGTPLMSSPDRPGLYAPSDRRHMNGFRYKHDPRGLRCPLGAHVRRTNPRDGLFGGAARTRRHRIVRRGMPYGAPLAELAGDDGADRGLVFVCFNASIARQFEVVQGWCVDGDAFGLGDDRDLLLAGGRGAGAKMTIQGHPPVVVAAPERALVTLRGGEYLLLPGVRALRSLAG